MNQTLDPFTKGMKKYGLSMAPRKRKVHPWSNKSQSGIVLGGYIEPEDEYNARFRLTIKAHSLVMQYLEEHDAPFREEDHRYYDILKLACEEHEICYEELFDEYEAILKAKE